jgi:hypothetical protein
VEIDATVTGSVQNSPDDMLETADANYLVKIQDVAPYLSQPAASSLFLPKSYQHIG